jgi:gamma-glutamylcyclotransferase (GGCT)/AIG2-like uncharacterized protein YtfP
MIRLFVYGTLKSRGFNNSWLGQEGEFIGTAWVYGELYKRGLPYLIKGKDKIKGEVYDVPNDVYMAISRMEYNAGYYEGITDAHLDDSRVEQCKVFYYDIRWMDKSKLERIIEY